MRLLITVLIASSALAWPAKSAEPIPPWWFPSMPHGGRDVFPFSPQGCCRHLQALHRVQTAKPTLNQGRNANAGAGVAVERDQLLSAAAVEHRTAVTWKRSV